MSKRLELDDNEAMLISAWVRSCYWLHPGLSDRLEVTLLPNSAVLLNGSSARETNSKASAGVDEVASDGSEEPFVTLGLKFLDGKVNSPASPAVLFGPISAAEEELDQPFLFAVLC